MKISARLVVSVVKWGLFLSVGWIVGLFMLAVGAGRLCRRFGRAKRALRETISCPWCGTQVSQYGTYGCASCHMRTRGWAWRCGSCGAAAGHIDCPSCGLSIPNPTLEG